MSPACCTRALNSIENQTDRQTNAFLRAANLVAMVGMPLCVWESLLAKPLLMLVYGTKWQLAIVPLELLSLGSLRLCCLWSHR